ERGEPNRREVVVRNDLQGWIFLVKRFLSNSGESANAGARADDHRFLELRLLIQLFNIEHETRAFRMHDPQPRVVLFRDLLKCRAKHVGASAEWRRYVADGDLRLLGRLRNAEARHY